LTDPGDAKAARAKPFAALRLIWHDYPGEWFTEEPSSTEEAARRVETFRLDLDHGVEDRLFVKSLW
jgi:hypothetical protein